LLKPPSEDYLTASLSLQFFAPKGMVVYKTILEINTK